MIQTPRAGAVLTVAPDLNVVGTAAADSYVDLALRREDNAEIVATARVQADGTGRFAVMLRPPLPKVTSGKYILAAVAADPSGRSSLAALISFFFRLDEPR